MGNRTLQLLCPHFPAVGQAALHICRCDGKGPSGHLYHRGYLHLVFRILRGDLVGSHRGRRKAVARNACFCGVHRNVILHHGVCHRDVLFQHAVRAHHPWREVHRFPVGHGTAADKELLFCLRPLYYQVY